MTDLTRLHSGNSRLYRPKPVEKKAVLCWEAASYQLAWGKQDFDGPHVRVIDGDSAYGVDTQVFFATYKQLAGKPDHYVKTAAVRAVQIAQSTNIETRVRERLEAKATIEPGGWLIQNPGGELYYNSAPEFERHYEPVPLATHLSGQSLEEHLAPKGPKRILALDGGGIRGRITLGILKGIERVLGGRLSDHFDLIGGTSTGSIIATGLALGWSVDRLIELYDQLGAEVFKSGLLRVGLWRAKFPTEPLERALQREFGDRRLGSADLQTGLCIVSKRLDTNSVWPLHNNPRGAYFGDPPAGRSYVPNKNYLLSQLVRASSAAPHFFDPERIAVSTAADGKVVEGAFVDGGASPHNNPSLQLVLLATLKGYGFGWPLGADRLQVVSVGTGTWAVRHAAADLLKKTAAENALLSLLSIMDDCSALTEVLMQWLSDSPTARQLDSEIGTLLGDLLGAADPWLSYLRYNATLQTDWLARFLPELKIDDKGLEALRRMDDPSTLKLLAKVGDAASSLVLPQHFAP
jgi:hypothetical protein